MLPDYQYKHYYDQLCAECEDEMVSQDEVYEEGGQCGECEKVMCEACREDNDCHLCWERLSNNEEYEKGSTAVCNSCAVTCNSCPRLVFHRSCLVEHRRGCNLLSRAKRELVKVDKYIEEKTRELMLMERRVDELANQIRASKQKKVKLQQKVMKIKQQARRV